jgi:SAM-dependent methyltransferase
MAEETPRIFDRALLRRRLTRALRRGAPDFLMARAADELRFRIATIRRDFPRAADVGTPTPHFAAALAAPERLVLRAAPTALPENGGSQIVCDEEALPFAPQSLDLVVSGLALQWVNDLPGVFAQVRRALRPDGLFLACLVGGASLIELRSAMLEAEIEITGGASPHISPFVDLRDLGGLLQRAGFALPVTDVDTVVLRYDSMFALCAELRAMGAANALFERRALTRGVLLRAAQIYAEKYADPDGRVRATLEMVWLSGWVPHESQQKPLKPGSAEVGLETALKSLHAPTDEAQ